MRFCKIFQRKLFFWRTWEKKDKRYNDDALRNVPIRLCTNSSYIFCLSTFLFLFTSLFFTWVHFPHGFSPSLCPAVGSARSCTLRELRATFISRARKPRESSLSIWRHARVKDRERKALCGWMYRLVACFRSGRLNSPPLCSRFRFNIAAWIQRTANRDDCINSLRWTPTFETILRPTYDFLATHTTLRHWYIYSLFVCNIKIYLQVIFGIFYLKKLKHYF